ncbi:MAG TPA: hypothetical protein VG713_06400, partial [Pirellulales bacterium]|nr:hypothetical protein [Pirellulales bacterium]
MASVAGMVVRRTVWLAALGFALVACRSAQAELIKVVDLPKITDATPLELGTVPEANVAGCVITIVNAQSQTNMVVSGYRCVREGDAWIVKSDKASSTALAVVRFDKNRLLFQWSADAPRALADGLRNCLISAQYDKSTETIALRKPVQAPGKPLDLTRESDLVTLELEDVPDQEKLTLELVGISGYDRTVRFMPENRRAQVKQPVMAILNPVETSSLSIQIKTTLNKLGPTLSLEV